MKKKILCPKCKGKMKLHDYKVTSKGLAKVMRCKDCGYITTFYVNRVNETNVT